MFSERLSHKLPTATTYGHITLIKFGHRGGAGDFTSCTPSIPSSAVKMRVFKHNFKTGLLGRETADAAYKIFQVAGGTAKNFFELICTGHFGTF